MDDVQYTVNPTLGKDSSIVLQELLEETNYLKTYWFRLRAESAMETTLIILTMTWGQVIGERYTNLFIFLDFSIAFDTMSVMSYIFLERAGS